LRGRARALSARGEPDAPAKSAKSCTTNNAGSAGTHQPKAKLGHSFSTVSTFGYDGSRVQSIRSIAGGKSSLG
jgi:hypothetical protein